MAAGIASVATSTCSRSESRKQQRRRRITECRRRLAPIGCTNIGSVHVRAWIAGGRNRPPKYKRESANVRFAANSARRRRSQAIRVPQLPAAGRDLDRTTTGVALCAQNAAAPLAYADVPKSTSANALSVRMTNSVHFCTSGYEQAQPPSAASGTPLHSRAWMGSRVQFPLMPRAETADAGRAPRLSIVLLPGQAGADALLVRVSRTGSSVTLTSQNRLISRLIGRRRQSARRADIRIRHR
jgi:hypothetical protein